MPSDALLVRYRIVLLLQTIHIFEEIAVEGNKLVGSLSKNLHLAFLSVFVS